MELRRRLREYPITFWQSMPDCPGGFEVSSIESRFILRVVGGGSRGAHTHTTTSLFLRRFTGDTFIGETAPKPDLRFIDKYREAVAKLGLAPEGLAASYSVAIRVRPHMVRGF